MEVEREEICLEQKNFFSCVWLGEWSWRQTTTRQAARTPRQSQVGSVPLQRGTSPACHISHSHCRDLSRAEGILKSGEKLSIASNKKMHEKQATRGGYDGSQDREVWDGKEPKPAPGKGETRDMLHLVSGVRMSPEAL